MDLPSIGPYARSMVKARHALGAAIAALGLAGCRRSEEPCGLDRGSVCASKATLAAELSEAGLPSDGGSDAGCPADCDVARFKELTQAWTVVGFERPTVENGSECCYSMFIVGCRGAATEDEREQARRELGARSPCR